MVPGGAGGASRQARGHAAAVRCDRPVRRHGARSLAIGRGRLARALDGGRRRADGGEASRPHHDPPAPRQIGSALCRGKGCPYVYTSVVAVTFNKKNPTIKT